MSQTGGVVFSKHRWPRNSHQTSSPNIFFQGFLGHKVDFPRTLTHNVNNFWNIFFILFDPFYLCQKGPIIVYPCHHLEVFTEPFLMLLLLLMLMLILFFNLSAVICSWELLAERLGDVKRGCVTWSEIARLQIGKMWLEGRLYYLRIGGLQTQSGELFLHTESDHCLALSLTNYGKASKKTWIFYRPADRKGWPPRPQEEYCLRIALPSRCIQKFNMFQSSFRGHPNIT